MDAYDQQRNSSRIELEDGKAIVILCLGEPRNISYKDGSFPVIDVRVVKTGEEGSLNLGRQVLSEKMMAYAPLTGKKLIVMSLGKPRGKRYYDYIVMTLAEYKKFKEDKKKGK